MPQIFIKLNLALLGVFIVGLQSVSAAADRDQLSCIAWLSDNDGPSQRVELTVAPYDKDFLEAHIDHFSYLVDTYYLPGDGVSLMIYNKTTKQYAQAVLGFRRISRTKYREARLTLAQHKNENEPQAQLVCVLSD